MISGLIYCESIERLNGKGQAHANTTNEQSISTKEFSSPGGHVNHESLRTTKRIDELHAS